PGVRAAVLAAESDGGAAGAPPGALKRHAVVVIDTACSCAVAPAPVAVRSVLWGAFELLLRDRGAVATEAGIVFQRGPRNWIVIVSEAEKATECQYGVGHLTRHLVDHDAFDRTDLLVVCAVDGRSFDLIASDQVTLLSIFHSGSSMLFPSLGGIGPRP